MQSLPWLLEAPADFNERCKRLASSADIATDVLRLANSDLSVNQCHRLYRFIKKSDCLRNRLKARLDTFKLGLVSNGTTDLLVPTLVVSGLRHGVFIELTTADFDQVMQEAINPESVINQSKPDAILVALDFRAFSFGGGVWAKTPAGADADAGLVMLQNIREGFRNNCGAICIVQTLAVPPHSLLGNLDRQIQGLLRKEIVDFNNDLVKTVSTGVDVVLDIAGVVDQVGSWQWFDERQWLMARMPMANEYIPLYSEHVARVIGALRGNTRKCLVLDLDNTIWGGVIGDDGMDGIVIGQGNPIGEAHLALQKYAQELKSLGVILAVCSKNEDAIAREVFQKHPEMLLREDDFAVFVANWNDKASNIQQIAQTLNIGLDALVFVDDNPAERDIVRVLLPQVAVPELPADPAIVPRTVAAAGYFETLQINDEDLKRSAQYAANTRRDEAMAVSTGVDDFLQSLEMKMSLSPFDSLGRKRITQLINKTNQFNLTTHRQTEPEVELIEKSDEYFTMQARLTDRFGDNGMVSVVICKKTALEWEIETWLMSCRVIKRRAEDAICDELVRQAKKAQVKTLKGLYKPTARNALVAEHYQNMGFTLNHCDSEAEIWTLDVATYSSKNPPIQVNGFQQEVEP